MPKGAPGQDYGRLLEKAKAADMGTIIIRALAGGALSGTDASAIRWPCSRSTDRLGAEFRGRRRARQGSSSRWCARAVAAA